VQAKKLLAPHTQPCYKQHVNNNANGVKQMELSTLVDDLNNRFQEWLEANAEQCSAEKLGLDRRAGNVYVSDEGVVIEKHNRRSFDWYGGGEYVADEHRASIGDYEVYYANDDRVMGWIENYHNSRST
jgi:hypothetical protein